MRLRCIAHLLPSAFPPALTCSPPPPQTVVGPSLEITSLAWARDTVSNTWRTFAAFLDGSVAEVAWRQSVVSYGQDSYGGVVWALAASPVECVKPGGYDMRQRLVC